MRDFVTGAFGVIGAAVGYGATLTQWDEWVKRGTAYLGFAVAAITFVNLLVSGVGRFRKWWAAMGDGEE
jgi:hypothetical protein